MKKLETPEDREVARKEREADSKRKEKYIENLNKTAETDDAIKKWDKRCASKTDKEVEKDLICRMLKKKNEAM